MIKAKEILNLVEDQHPIGKVDLDKFLGILTSTLKIKTKLNVVGTFVVGKFGPGVISFEYKYPLGRNQTSDSFFEQSKLQLRIPIKNLELVCKGEFKLVEPSQDFKYYWKNLDVDIILRTMSVNLFLKGEFLHLILHSGVIDEDSDDSGTIKTFYSIPLSQDRLDKLIDAIAEVFIGYKKLINQFNNRPMKKTNADW